MPQVLFPNVTTSNEQILGPLFLEALAEADAILSDAHAQFEKGDLLRVVQTHCKKGHAAKLAAYVTIGAAAAMLDSGDRYLLGIVAKKILATAPL